MSRRNAPEWFNGGDRGSQKQKGNSLNNSRSSSSSKRRSGGDKDSSKGDKASKGSKKEHRRSSSRKRGTERHGRKKSQESISLGSDSTNAIFGMNSGSASVSTNPSSIVRTELTTTNSANNVGNSSSQVDKGKKQNSKPQKVSPPTTTAQTTATTAAPSSSISSSPVDKKSFISTVADTLFGRLRSSSESEDKNNNNISTTPTNVVTSPPPPGPPPSDYISMDGKTPRTSHTRHRIQHSEFRGPSQHNLSTSSHHVRSASEPLHRSYPELSIPHHYQNQYQLTSPSTFPSPNAYASMRRSDHGHLPTVDSDDQFTYSDDDTTVNHQLPYPNNVYQNRQPPIRLPEVQQQHHQRSLSIPNTNTLYPSYVPQEEQNQEMIQLREQQQLMAMQQTQQYQRSHPLSPERHHSQHQQTQQQDHSSYHTTISSTQTSNVSPNKSYGSVSNAPINEMYMSEDGSMTSVQSGSSQSLQYDRFFFHGPHVPNRPIDEKGRQSPIAEEINGSETTSLLSSVNSMQTSSLLSSISTIETKVPSEPSREATNEMHNSDSSEFPQSLLQAMEQRSIKINRPLHSQTLEEPSTSSSSGNSSPSPTMLATQSSSTSSSSGGTGNCAVAPNPSSSNTPQNPPPIQSVKVYDRSFSTGTTASSSVTPNKANLSVSMKKLSNFQKRERKKIRKRKEKVERIEDRVQGIVRDGHTMELDWSSHVPQEVDGRNRPAGFFPTASRKFHDVLFGILFLLQLAGIIYVAIRYGKLAIMNKSDEEYDPMDTPTEVNYDDPFSTGIPSSPTGSNSPLSIWAQDIHVEFSNAFQLSCIAAIQSTFLSALALGMMMILRTGLIQVFLCFTVILCFLFGAIGLILSPYNVIPVLGIVALLLSLIYCIVVWDTIPFSAVNLNTALIGIQSSAEILLVALWMMVVAFFWTIIWAVAFLGIYDCFLTKDSIYDVPNSATWTGWSVYIGMFTSFFWTLFVITNFVHVTVAGVIGEWWSSPESHRFCCNSVLYSQVWKAMTSSFGSICLGSLILAPAQLLQILLTCFSASCSAYPQPYSHMVHSDSIRDVSLRDLSIHKDQFSVISDVSDKSSNNAFNCILNSCNEFGFTYIGVYGESFITASRKAAAVFKARDWLGAVSNRLIPHVLFITSVIIALCTGFFAFLVEEFDGYNFTNFRKPTSTAFLIGCCVGLVMSHVCLKVVGSSVKAVLVCFSIAPYAFQQHHPILSNELRLSWGVDFLDDFLIQFGSGEFA